MTPKELDKILGADLDGCLDIGPTPFEEVIGVYNSKTKELLYFRAFTSFEKADETELDLVQRYHTPNSIFTDLGDFVWAEDDVFLLLRYAMPRKISERVLKNLWKFLSRGDNLR